MMKKNLVRNLCYNLYKNYVLKINVFYTSFKYEAYLNSDMPWCFCRQYSMVTIFYLGMSIFSINIFTYNVNSNIHRKVDSQRRLSVPGKTSVRNHYMQWCSGFYYGWFWSTNKWMYNVWSFMSFQVCGIKLC